MITEKHLRKAGFTPQEKQPLDDGGWYIDWFKHVRDHPLILIEVSKLHDRSFKSALIVGSGPSSQCIPLHAQTVTELITLAKLLK